MNNDNQSLFLKPLDVLYLRGNKLFGGGGDHADALMPPWPSIASGALRSRIMADADIDFRDFKEGRTNAELSEIIGTPVATGSFRVTEFSVAQFRDGKAHRFYPLPADCFVGSDSDGCSYLSPVSLPAEISTSHQLQKVAVLKRVSKSKSKMGIWLTESGWQKYLVGEAMTTADLININKLWTTDLRLGIALDSKTGSAAESKIYTTDVVDFTEETGFICSVSGAKDLLPQEGLIRLGGDGHAASLTPVGQPDFEIDWQRIQHERRFRLVATTPALFKNGWLPTGISAPEFTLKTEAFSARLTCASLGRNQVVSGWDMVTNLPKTALKTVPVCSVYWFEEFDGEIETLQQLAAEGFWMLSGYPSLSRKAEGFNQLIVAPWAQH